MYCTAHARLLTLAILSCALAFSLRYWLWLPGHALSCPQMCVMLCADHGPCVSGAHNAIVTSRAGKDIVSSLVSGLLTIGPRFGGAIDDAAR